MKKFLIISRSAPYGSSAAREALELALAATLFDQPVAILLLDDGVYQLLPNQAPAAIQQKNLGAMQQALPLYDIDRIYVSARAMAERGLTPADLALPVEAISDTQLAKFLSQQDVVLNV